MKTRRQLLRSGSAIGALVAVPAAAAACPAPPANNLTALGEAWEAALAKSEALGAAHTEIEMEAWRVRGETGRVPEALEHAEQAGAGPLLRPPQCLGDPAHVGGHDGHPARQSLGHGHAVGLGPGGEHAQVGT